MVTEEEVPEAHREKFFNLTLSKIANSIKQDQFDRRFPLLPPGIPSLDTSSALIPLIKLYCARSSAISS